VGQRLGQHFLGSARVLERIALAVCPQPEPLVVEIGAGRGALTRQLLARAGRVVAIETDPRLAGGLEQTFAGTAGLLVVRGDVMSTDLTKWGPAVFAGNLPYYLTSPILRRVLTLGDAFLRAVFLVQKEVAGRLVAQPGSRAYGFLTVQTAAFAAAEMLFTVPPSAFRPPPKVDSALVRLTPRPVEEPDPAGFLEFVSQCFRQKRKTLRNNLAGRVERRLLEDQPEASLRAEQLSLEQFRSLHRRLARR
jgi:16S rRNA (adenine1518-N6/adenine1519-N6)-dimethyltransferase